MSVRSIPRVKICCIANRHEARLATDAGADALGLVGPMPSGPGVISFQQIRDIVHYVSPPIATFLLTSATSAKNIITQHRRTNTTVIQIVDALPPGEYSSLRQSLTGIKLVQVIHVIDRKSVDQALEYSSLVDALLLDSGNPNLAIKELGGTGRTHNWRLSRMIVEQSPVPAFLAGGLNPENVAEAIRQVQPFAVDVCNGVRSAGKLDAEKLENFMRAVYNSLSG